MRSATSGSRRRSTSSDEKSPSCCRRRRGISQLAFRIESERGRRADLEQEEYGEGGEEEDAVVALPHLGGGEELQRPPTEGISKREGAEKAECTNGGHRWSMRERRGK